MVHNKIQNGLKDGVPICVGYFSVSFTFGMMAVKSGISPFHAVLISLFNLTSAGQFAGLNVIVYGADTAGCKHPLRADVPFAVSEVGFFGEFRQPYADSLRKHR